MTVTMIKQTKTNIDGIDYTMPEAVCNQCGYTWILRRVKPSYCPQCRSSHWDKPNTLTYRLALTKAMLRISKLDNLTERLSGEDVRNRDSNTCQICGKANLPESDVYHIDNNSSNNYSCNQVLLCHRCRAVLASRQPREATDGLINELQATK